MYIHCKSGRGRSAAIAMGWLLQVRKMKPLEANTHLMEQRRVRAKLFLQKNIIQFYDELQEEMLHTDQGAGGGGTPSRRRGIRICEGTRQRRKGMCCKAEERLPQRRAAVRAVLCVRCPSKLARPLPECLGRAEEGTQAHLLMARQVMRCRKVMDMVPHHQIGIKSQRMECGR